jgi:hypothetical protein
VIWADSKGPVKGFGPFGPDECLSEYQSCVESCKGNVGEDLYYCNSACGKALGLCLGEPNRVSSGIGAGGPGQPPPPNATLPPGATVPPIAVPIHSPPPDATVPPNGTNPISRHPVLGPVRGLPSPSPTRGPVILVKTTPTPTPKPRRKLTTPTPKPKSTPVPTPKPTAKPTQQTSHHSKDSY